MSEEAVQWDKQFCDKTHIRVRAQHINRQKKANKKLPRDFSFRCAKQKENSRPRLKAVARFPSLLVLAVVVDNINKLAISETCLCSHSGMYELVMFPGLKSSPLAASGWVHLPLGRVGLTHRSIL